MRTTSAYQSLSLGPSRSLTPVGLFLRLEHQDVQYCIKRETRVNTKRLLIAVSKDDQKIIANAIAGYRIESIVGHPAPWTMFQQPETSTILILDPDCHPVLYDHLVHYSISTHSLCAVILLTDKGASYHLQEDTILSLLEKPLNALSLQALLTYLRTQATFHNSHAQSKLLGMLFAHTNTALVMTNATTFGKLTNQHSLLFNPAAVSLLGIEEEQCRALDWALLFHPDDRSDFLAGLHTGKGHAQEIRYKKSDGSYKHLHITVITIGEWYLCSIKPSEVQSSHILHHLRAMPFRCKADEAWTPLALTEECKLVTGYTEAELSTLSFSELIVPSYRMCVKQHMNRALAEKKTTTLAYEIQTASGEHSNILEISHGIYACDGSVEAIEGILLSADDGTTIEHSRSLDNNTGLKTGEYLENLLAYDTQKHPSHRRSLIHINLSTIHAHTLTYGLCCSQVVLNRVAKHLKGFITESCILCKTFENHYTFYLKDYPCRQVLLDFCQTLSTELKTLLRSEGFESGIGLLELPKEQGLNYDTVMHHVMIASEEALSLRHHREGFCEFSKELEEKSRRKEAIITELSHIVAGQRQERLYVLFQPIVTLATNQITEFEVLARLSSDTLGLVNPTEFIPLAEQTKYIISLGYLIIEHALHFLATLHAQGWHTVNISINVSAVQLLEADFVERLLSLIEQSGVSSSQICLEITESSLMTNFEEINALFAELQAQDITIALDDFGTGYSSLCHERKLKLNALKIDKVFIDGLFPDEPSITENIINMGHKLGHQVIAEGVQNTYQREYLTRYGCDKIQGYLVNTPLSQQEALRFLQTYPV